MIKYTLTCDQNHRFDSWFANANAFDKLAAAGHVACATCGSTKVQRALMAPALATTGRDEAPLTTPQSDVENALDAMRKEVEENSDYVGLSFASEARKMHEGEAPERAIYGEARADEARQLIEDGIPVAPLPFRPKRNTQ